MGDHRGITTSSGTKRKRAVSEVEKNEEENQKTTIKPPAPKMFSPPEKYDWKSNVIESPNGEVKLKINRTLLSESKRFNVNENQFVQRISRRTSTQLGISPDKLLKMQTRSPSPVKKIRGLIDKENFESSSVKYSPLSSTSLYNLTTSPILNMPIGRRNPRGLSGESSPSSPNGKRRRVSKKLYN